MIRPIRCISRISAAQVAALLFALAALGACTNTARFGGEPNTAAVPPPETAAAPVPAPAAPQPPPIDLAGKWKLFVAPGGGCLMTLTANPGAIDGKVAPAGGCPGNFFTSRKWTYESDILTIRDFKGQGLAELSFADGHFEGKNSAGGAITLARP
ncbi:MAG TPA: AprI/Inh family metalloprotease inhibitor [Xanthobacteraceae bacterium]|nr:AprI/Inh family metalloprotease inhibitor [Xanthobacteraceae bacterium]